MANARNDSEPQDAGDVSIQIVDAASASLLDRVAEGVFDHEVRPELLARFLACPSSVLVVAVAGGSVVGMATGLTYVHPDKPLAMFINEVGVADRFRRRGIARRLIGAIVERAKELGCREAWVATEVDNAPARGLYRATGGVEEPERAVVYLYPLDGS